MEKKFTLKLPENIILKAKENGIELCCPEENSVTMDLKENCVPEVHGVCIGRVDRNTDELVSNIKDDKTAEELRKYIDAGLVTTKIFCQMVDGPARELKHVPYYFIVYDVMESSKQKSTYTESSAGNGTPIKGHYACQYEVLLGSEEYTRRMVFKEETVNVSMYSWINNLISELEDNNEHIGEHFYESEDGNICFTMFDEVGIPTEVELDIYEFESMIVGIRQISCEYVDKE